MDRGREAGDQGQGIHFHRDRAIPEGFLWLDGDQAFLGEGDVLLGHLRPEHILEQVGSADIVFGADAGSGQAPGSRCVRSRVRKRITGNASLLKVVITSSPGSPLAAGASLQIRLRDH
jgi:hypothetical protein